VGHKNEGKKRPNRTSTRKRGGKEGGEFEKECEKIEFKRGVITLRRGRAAFA